MKGSRSNIAIAVLALALVGLLTQTIFNIQTIDANKTELQNLQNQRDQDLAELQVQNQALNQTLNQAIDALNQTQAQTNSTIQTIQDNLQTTQDNLQAMDDLLNGKITDVAARLPVEEYDCIIYRVWNYVANVSDYVAKDGKTGLVVLNSTDAAYVFNQALLRYNTVFVKASDYNLTSDVVMADKKNACVDSDGATLYMFGHSFWVKGESFETSQRNQLSGLIINNGTVRIENSFHTTVTNMIFQNCTVGVELVNTNTWTEASLLDTIHFDKCVQGIVFRTNTSDLTHNSTGSYGSTEINRCYFNQLDNSIAITVERDAIFTDSQMNDVRIWIGQFDTFNQTGLLLEGSMYKTVLYGVVFESFAPQPLDGALIYGVVIDPFAFQPPILDGGVNFLGCWTARIFNPGNVWIYGVGGIFKFENVAIPIATGTYGETQIIQIHPASITSFNPKISVGGSFQNNETVTVRLRLEFIDNVVSDSLEKTFNTTSSIWLSNDDFLQLYTSPNVLYCILVDAKANSQTDATVTIDLYGASS